ncbi:unnamed protein product [Vicia faba]|uniref:ABC transmembrane type-1 domain-containing protein n=1 Tax=Vicia faba TaxID=3906 RepID=A0AAV0YMA7_VICFA|nr:unnamed protein product [Vicia faba]
MGFLVTSRARICSALRGEVSDAGERQSTKIRIKYLEAALKQDIEFFDTKVRTSDAVFTISIDAVMVQDAISEKTVVHIRVVLEIFVKYTLPQVAEAISQNHFGFTGYCVSDAVKQVNSCNNKFSELVLAPLGNRNGVVHKFVDVSYAIIKKLLKD